MTYQNPAPRYKDDSNKPSFFQTPLFKVVAAVVLLGIAAGYYFYSNREEKPLTTAALPDWAKNTPPEIMLSMAATHEACVKGNMDQFISGAPKDDAMKAAQALAKQFKHPIMAPNLSTWKLRHCGVCKVGDKQAAHLLYTEGDRRLSVFSIPAADWGDVGIKSQFEGGQDGKVMIAIVKDGNVYAFIAQGGGMTSVDLQQVVRGHSDEVARPQ
jgi:hypothetical protein